MDSRVSRVFYIECDCHSPEHTVRLEHFVDNDPYLEVYAEIHLVQHPFLRRVWQALRYVLGYRSRYGDWDEIVLTKNTIRELRDWLSQTLTIFEEQKNEGNRKTNQ